MGVLEKKRKKEKGFELLNVRGVSYTLTLFYPGPFFKFLGVSLYTTRGGWKHFSSQLILGSDMGSLLWVWTAVVGSLVFVLRIVIVIWWKPLQMKQCFQSQGVSGPAYRLLNGSGCVYG